MGEAGLLTATEVCGTKPPATFVMVNQWEGERSGFCCNATGPGTVAQEKTRAWCFVTEIASTGEVIGWFVKAIEPTMFGVAGPPWGNALRRNSTISPRKRETSPPSRGAHC